MIIIGIVFIFMALFCLAFLGIGAAGILLLFGIVVILLCLLHAQRGGGPHRVNAPEAEGFITPPPGFGPSGERLPRTGRVIARWQAHPHKEKETERQ